MYFQTGIFVEIYS